MSRSCRARCRKPPRLRPVARCSRSSSTSRNRVSGAHRVDRHRRLHAIARGERQDVAAAPPRASPAGPRGPPSPGSRTAARSPSAQSRASARSRRPPGGETRPPPGRTSPPRPPPPGLEARRRRRRGPRRRARRCGESGSASRSSAASAAAVTFAPLPCGRRRLTTWAPRASATSDVPSVDASSATTTSAPGKRPRKGVQGGADPVGLVVRGDDHHGIALFVRRARADILPRRVAHMPAAPPAAAAAHERRSPHHRNRVEGRGGRSATRSPRATRWSSSSR